MVTPLEEVRKGGDCKKDEAVEVGVYDRLCAEGEGPVAREVSSDAVEVR
jgi:hypothetical protein